MQICIVHLSTLMVSEITFKFKMAFKSRHCVDKIHFDLRSDWCIRKACKSTNFHNHSSKNKARIGERKE